MLQLPMEITLIALLIALVAIILYIREYFLRKKDYQLTEKISKDTKQKSLQLLKAAQMAETEVLAEGNFVTQKLILEFKAKIDDLIKASEKSLTNQQDQLIHFMADLQKRAEQFEQASKATTEQRINDTFERLENKLSDFLIQTEQKTASSIELELKAARQLIETYKQQQLKLIDENIIAMLEQTMNLVLSKKLSLKDQLELVYQALEKAKVEKFIV